MISIKMSDNMKEERVKLILESLSENYISSNVLASQIGVSSKTIRNEIKKINSILKHHGAIIQTKPKKGIALNIIDEIKYTKFTNSLSTKQPQDIPATFEQRVQYLIEYLLNAQQWTKIEYLADKLFVSRSILSQTLKEVRKRLKEYNIELVSKPGYGLKAIGSEFDFRVCMTNIIVDNVDNQTLPDNKCENDKREILKKISQILNKNFEFFEYHMSDVSFHNLIIHIYVALCRIEEGQETYLSSEQMNQVHEWKEYKMAHSIVEDLSEEFNVDFPDDEIGYIAIHLAAKRIVSIDETENGNVIINGEVYEIVSHMLRAVYDSYHIDLMDDLELRMMLVLHLVPFGVRMAYDLVLHNPLLVDIKTKYTMAYNLAVVASEELRKHYNKEIKEDEIGYFALHFNLALERKNRKQDKKNILIVCGTGRGTAQLLMYQFKDNFGKYLNQIYTSDALGIKNIDFTDIDYVITTVPIAYSVPVPILEIKSFVEDRDVKTIKRFLSQGHSRTMEKYFRKDLFLTNVGFETKEEVLQYMVKKIESVYDIPSDFYDAILHRERQAGTEFGNLVAIPHPYKAMTKETFVCICILNKPIIWDKKKVQLIYLMSMEDNSNRNLMTFYKITSKLLVNPKYVNELIQNKRFEVLLSLFGEIESTLE